MFFQICMGMKYLWQPFDQQRSFLLRLTSGDKQDVFHIKDMDSEYFYHVLVDDICVKEGTILNKSSPGKCVCKSEWKGKRCGMPKILQTASWMKNATLYSNLQIRKKPRRIILAITFSGAFEILEANVNEMVGLVDVFLLGEMNYTQENNVKTSLPLLERLKSGWLSEHQHKFIYIPVPEKDIVKSSFLQNVVDVGLRMISDIRPDDLLMFSNGNEILRRNVMIFLKIFRNYPLPIQCHYQHYIYGFFYKANKDQSGICGITIHLLSNAFEYKLSRLETGLMYKEDVKFFQNVEQPIVSWVLPDAGWKCLFCLPPEDLYSQLVRFPNASRPQWFKNSSTSMIPFIERLMKFGQNLDLEPVGVAHIPPIEELPNYVSQNRIVYKKLLQNPYEIITLKVLQNIDDESQKTS